MSSDIKTSQQTKSLIHFNDYRANDLVGEAFFPDHIFSHISSGGHEIWSDNQTYSFKPGDYRFFRRNQLIKFAKRVTDKGFKSIAVHIDQPTLRLIAEEYDLGTKLGYNGNNVELLKPNKYLSHYIGSLTPYSGQTGIHDKKIETLKVKELILLLLQTNPRLQPALFDFTDPGKVDMNDFMQRHFRYNVGLDRMAFLTGRSLSTFKRDFQLQFHTTPGRWLAQRRLEEAQYLLTKKGKTASEIYLDLGFEDLSHFSYAYKKAFGAAPGRMVR